jgi:hypothetical protein
MNDNTRIRIAVPAHLYESVKKQLTLKEAKQNFGAGFTAVKEKKMTGESKPKVEGMKSSKAPKMEGEKTEKTVEERLDALEKLVKSMAKGKSMKDEGIEDEIGYEAGQQQPDYLQGVQKSVSGKEDKNGEK